MTNVSTNHRVRRTSRVEMVKTIFYVLIMAIVLASASAGLFVAVSL